MTHRLAGALAAAGLAALALPAGSAGAATPTPPGTYALYCSGSTATSFTGCYADGQSSDVSIPAGSSVTTDPTVPATALATSGLTAPDGILGVIPAADVPSSLGVPAGAVTFLYIDKQVGYFIPGALVSKVTLPLTSPTTIPVTADYTAHFGTGPATFYLGGNSSGTIRSISCSSVTATSLVGCTSSDGSTADSVSAGNSVGAPGSCIVPSAALATIGEGSTKPKTLFKNNEDYANVQLAYTTNGTTFHDITPAGGIGGLGSPTAQSGTRWISPGGSIIDNGDGSLGMFYSAGQCTDGDSDAFGTVLYSTSTDGGLHWSTGTAVPDADHAYGTGTLSTDYTYSASIAEHSAAPGTPLDVSAYYEGRIYSPSVVQNGDGTLSMTFAGYRTSKPLPAVGSAAIGRASETSTAPATTQYSPTSADAALYRNILTVQLTKVAGSNPATYTAGLPVVAQVQGGPWTLSQGDPSQAPYGPNGETAANGAGSQPYSTFTNGGGPTTTTGGSTYPNLATYPGSGPTGTALPLTTGYAGAPGPLAGYCGSGTPTASSTPASQPAGLEPMSPYYFPHIESDGRGGLVGYFDYRPKDTDEATVVATSADQGRTWTFQTEALELSAAHCPLGNPDVVAQTTTDDGQGHPFDLTVGGTRYLYTVNRSSGTLDTVGSQFLAHVLTAGTASLGLPASEPVGTQSSTTSTGTQTVTHVVGGTASTTAFNVASTAGFNEIPGRIYVTTGPPPGLPESPAGWAIPAAGAGLLGLGLVAARRRRSAAPA